jgi:hypothetical protein
MGVEENDSHGRTIHFDTFGLFDERPETITGSSGKRKYYIHEKGSFIVSLGYMDHKTGNYFR